MIVDLSPVAPVVDARSATHLVDSYLFVIEWGKTKIDVVEHSLNSARGRHTEQGQFQTAQSLRRPRELLLQSPLRPLRLHGLMLADRARRNFSVTQSGRLR